MIKGVLTVVVEILQEVGLAREAAGELVGVHVGQSALLCNDGLRIDHFLIVSIFESIIGINSK